MSKKATIYRMVAPDHLCPWGIKAFDLLKRNGFEIDDQHIKSKEANEAYKKDTGYGESPQIFIEGERLGGYDELREYLKLGPDPKEGESYQPVLPVWMMAKHF